MTWDDIDKLLNLLMFRMLMSVLSPTRPAPRTPWSSVSTPPAASPVAPVLVATAGMGSTAPTLMSALSTMEAAV